MNTDDTYLRTVYLLERLQAGRVDTGALADRLSVSPSTATEMVSKLDREGLLDHERYHGVRLTDAGERRARDALKNYCLVQRFLHDVLDLSEYHSEADAIEHVVDEDVAEQLLSLVEREAECPDCFDPLSERCRRLDDDRKARNGAGACDAAGSDTPSKSTAASDRPSRDGAGGREH